MKNIIFILTVSSMFIACKRERKSLEVADADTVPRPTRIVDDSDSGPSVFEWDGYSDIALGGLSIENI